jgi:hypothetical protein
VKDDLPITYWLDIPDPFGVEDVEEVFRMVHALQAEMLAEKIRKGTYYLEVSYR